MTPDQLLELAERIYTLKCLTLPSYWWDYQQTARDSLNMAMQFSLAVQAAQDQDSTATAALVQTDSPPASQGLTAPADTGSSAAPAPPDSTTGSAADIPATDSTVGVIAGAGPASAPAADTDLSQSQSQTQPAPLTQHVQAQPFAPVSQ